MPRNVQIIVGHTLDVLRSLPAQSVHAVVTSPPYWSLRNYFLEPQIWGGDAAHAHEWGKVQRTAWANAVKGPASFTTGKNGTDYANVLKEHGQHCECGAWLGSLGLEPNPEAYVAHIVDVFREVRRVLRDDGTLWLNLGDCYSANAGQHKPTDRAGIKQQSNVASTGAPSRTVPGLGAKNLVGIPWRVAFALQADGWTLRSEIIWAKPNVMPESVRDRPTRAHEQIFLLTKGPRYFYDPEAIKERAGEDTHARYARGRSDDHKYADGGPGRQTIARTFAHMTPKSSEPGNGIKANHSFHAATGDIVGYRNSRSVWSFPSEPLKESHFAAFPTELARRCIAAGTSEKGCCASCGAPWKRIVEPSEEYAKHLGKDWADYDQDAIEGRGHSVSDQRPVKRGAPSITAEYNTKGWQPTCKCSISEVTPAVVLDPFGGAGTSGLVAARLDRSAILVELNPSYAEMARNRIEQDAPLLNHVTVTEFGK